MANRLGMATIQAILSLRARHWSYRRIGRELGIHRETVARYVRQAGSNPAKAPLGPPADEAPIGGCLRPEPAKAPLGSADSPHELEPLSAPLGRSACEPWRELILSKLSAGLSAQRIYQDLVSEHGFPGSYHSVKRFVRRLSSARPLPFRRLECGPGEEAQVDFGTGAPLVDGAGRRRKTHVFRVVLSHSRKAYSEVMLRQTTDDFLRALESAFRHFGGVPKTLVIDNLKAAVRHPDWFDPELTPKVQSFCRHYGTVILPTKPYTPRHKGKVERGVGYVKDNALKGRTFARLEEQNHFLAEWEARVADQRIHGTTRQQVSKLFAEQERSALLPLPAEPFPCFQEAERRVNRDGHVEVAKAYYSAPPEYLGRTVWVRWDQRVVRLFNQRFEQIALHVRREPGRFSTLGEHVAAEKISGVERGAGWLLAKLHGAGEHTERWAQAMLAERGLEGVRVLQGLLALVKRQAGDALEQACQTAHSYGEYRLRTLRRLLARQPAQPQQRFEFAAEHPLIRPLADYGAFVRGALRRPANPALGFRRHGRAIESLLDEKSPDDARRRGLRVIHPPRSGYSSSGCSPAEPDSASPDNASVVRVSLPELRRCDP